MESKHIKHKLMRTLAFTLLMVSAVSAAARAGTAVHKVSEGRTISFEQMIEEVRKSDIVFVGELHGSAEHHELQLAVIRALHEADVPLAVGLEMFRQDSQHELNQWVEGKVTEKQFVSLFYENWRVAWPLYRPIFRYAREHGVPLVGLNVPGELSRKVSRKGFSSLTEKERKALPPGITCDVDRTYMAFIKQAYSDHGVDKKSFINFCEAQMVWDTSMAWHIIEYRRKNPGGVIVVLAGTGHAWKRGIPEQVRRQSGLSFKVILPEIPSRVEQGKITIEDADYIFLQ
jgi:uncharacterized iron-regulated protein